MLSNHFHQAPGHVPVTTAVIGSLAMVLAVGLAALGLTDIADAAVANFLRRALQPEVAAGFPKALPAWGVWLATALLSYALAFAMLGVAGTWRRLVLWCTTLGLVAGWAPVLGLAAHAPHIAAPLIATLWSGACALVYTHSHRMPCDVEAR
ncbi:MAG: hypothetical protein WCP35_02380 [Verrucomicrobiota bacterium]